MRAVDIQQILLQSNAIERVQESQQQEPIVQQKHFENQLNKEQHLLKEKIRNLEKAEQLIIKEKNKKYKRHRDTKMSNKKTKKKKISDRNHDTFSDKITRKLDIKV